MAETRRFTVRYSAATAGAGPLTLGQDNMIRCVLREQDQMDLNKQSVWPVPPGTDVPGALAALRTLAERHEALRTVFTGPPGAMPVRQEVRSTGEFEVSVLEADRGQDPDTVAAESGRRDRAARFDLTGEFPLRPTLVTVDGVPVRLAVVVSHAAADATATGILVREWYELAAGRTLPPPTGQSPREVARLEQSKAGRQRAQHSLRRWERILTEAPRAVFAHDRVGRPHGVLPTMVLRSPSAAVHLDQAAKRLGASPSNVLLGVFSALIAHCADERTVVLAALAANRHRAALADYVGTLAQDALLCVDADAPDLDGVIRNAAAESLGGYWYSTFEALALWQLIADVADRRGAGFARQVVLNDMSSTIPDAAVADRPAPPRDPELTWLPSEVIPTRLMLNVWRLSGCVELSLHADPQLFDRDEAERFAAGMLRLIEAAARGPLPTSAIGALTGIDPPRRTGEWVRIDNSWIDLAAVRELLDDALDKRPVDLRVHEGRLTARIAEDGRPITPRRAHEAVMSASAGRETTLAPHMYVVCEGAPRTQDEWDRAAVTAQGDGR
jgi:Condensation domain